MNGVREWVLGLIAAAAVLAVLEAIIPKTAAGAMDLLGTQQTARSEKQEKLEQAMDAIRGKYGKDAISFGSNGGKQVGWDD